MQHGGKRRGAGRPKGSTKKGTKIDEFNMMLRAQNHSEDMLSIIVDLAHNSLNESIQLAAATQILDRAHGKPGQIKMPEPDDGTKALAEAMIAFNDSPYMNRDAPLVGNRDASSAGKSILDED